MGDATTNMGSSQTVSNSGHFSDYEFLPAVIVVTDDPMKLGRIKVTALGAYNANNSTFEQLPWCYPFTMHGNNTYTSYEKGSKVWLIRNTKRQDENWFIPMYEPHLMSQNYVDSVDHSDKPEIINIRNNGGEQSSITYDHKNGYNIYAGGVGGGSSLNIGTDSSATINAGGTSIITDNEGVTVGINEQDTHPAVLGDNLKELFQYIFSCLGQFAVCLSKDPWAGDAASYLKEWTLEMANSDKYEEFLSNIVKIKENK